MLLCEAAEMKEVAGVVAVDQVDRQAQADDRTQGRGCDQISAVQHRMCAQGLCLGNGGGERLTMVVAVGDNTDLQSEPPRRL